MNNLSNYPPGVTGNEREIAGLSDEEEALCAKCPHSDKEDGSCQVPPDGDCLLDHMHETPKPDSITIQIPSESIPEGADKTITIVLVHAEPVQDSYEAKAVLRKQLEDKGKELAGVLAALPLTVRRYLEQELRDMRYGAARRGM